MFALFCAFGVDAHPSMNKHNAETTSIIFLWLAAIFLPTRKTNIKIPTKKLKYIDSLSNYKLLFILLNLHQARHLIIFQWVTLSSIHPPQLISYI